MGHRSWDYQEAEGADALMQPWTAELGPTEGISREAGLAQHVPGHGMGSPGRQQATRPGQSLPGLTHTGFLYLGDTL